MFLFIVAVVVLLAISFAISAGIIFGVSKLFKIKKCSYHQSLIILGATTLIQAAVWLIFGLLHETELASIISAILSIWAFFYFYKKYYQAAWKKTLGILIVAAVISALVSIAIVIPIRKFVFEPFAVKGAAMEPAYNDGDYLLATKIDRNFQRGDVVIMNYLNKTFMVKRIVGLPGETIEIKNNQVLINNQVLTESYVLGSMADADPLVIGSDQYFVLGDNRPQSFDSRYFGPVLKADIVGKVFFDWPQLMINN
ncbi:MAG: signal peptidase I [bacterium]